VQLQAATLNEISNWDEDHIADVIEFTSNFSPVLDFVVAEEGRMLNENSQ
jgi:hypothetical protein